MEKETKWGSKAKKYMDDSEKAQDLLKRATRKAEGRKGPLEEIWDGLMLMFGLLGDWIAGKYKDVSWQTIGLIVVGLIYFVSPLDIIPDILGPLGLGDDAVVLGLIIAQIKHEIDSYSIWKKMRHEQA